MHLLETGNKFRRYSWLLRLVLTKQFEEYILISDFIHERAFGKMSSEELITSYTRHNAELRADPRVVVMDPREGWGKLCEILHVQIPDIPYPHLNSQASLLKRHVLGSALKYFVLWYVLPLCVAITVYWMWV